MRVTVPRQQFSWYTEFSVEYPPLMLKPPSEYRLYKIMKQIHYKMTPDKLLIYGKLGIQFNVFVIQFNIHCKCSPSARRPICIRTFE